MFQNVYIEVSNTMQLLRIRSCLKNGLKTHSIHYFRTRPLEPCPQQPITALYFESETVLKFYYLQASMLKTLYLHVLKVSYARVDGL